MHGFEDAVVLLCLFPNVAFGIKLVLFGGRMPSFLCCAVSVQGGNSKTKVFNICS